MWACVHTAVNNEFVNYRLRLQKVTSIWEDATPVNDVLFANAYAMQNKFYDVIEDKYVQPPDIFMHTQLSMAFW